MNKIILIESRDTRVEMHAISYTSTIQMKDSQSIVRLTRYIFSAPFMINLYIIMYSVSLSTALEQQIS